MELVVNGETRTLPELGNVADLLRHFKLEHKILVIELNRTIVNRDQYENTALNEGDRVEIVHFVGGG